MKNFTRLRALKLIEVNDNSKSFSFDLYNLQHLVSLEIDVKTDLPLINSIPPLKRLSINILSCEHFNIKRLTTRISFEQLHQLSLSNCPATELQRILRQAIRLTSLKMSFKCLNNEYINMLANFHQEQSTKSTLVYLTLSIDVARELTHVHLERFLAPLQCLRRLELVIARDAKRQFLDAGQWENFITEYLPRLITFEFKFSSEWRIGQYELDQFRSPFWLDKRWFIAYNSSRSCLFTVPYFVPTSIKHSFVPVSPNLTTLPIEQHMVFYDRVTELRLQGHLRYLPYRYNHVKILIIDTFCTYQNIIDLSKVQSLTVDISTLSLSSLMTAIKRSMPCVNYLSLNGSYWELSYMSFTGISLEQVRVLCLSRYANYQGDNTDKWSRLFPHVERLIVSIVSKSQIPLLIDQFKNIVSGFFYIDPPYIEPHNNDPLYVDPSYIDQIHIDAYNQIQVTHEWLMEHVNRFRQSNMDNFTYQINEGDRLSLSLWIGEDDKVCR
ncbi:unnamed protein product [Rotaria sp. Silwood1]|nr:unnamed protein product [Rotaria sp. Silwood1]CAF3657356.1 unnamed protein product [Rotaria sp. Silwood1]CAF3695524.1 unnamed protein product [Rotaria sp. Silwood1]CAF4634414.1 unnamed protein product [Rotaria sp. Silwood1]CAF4658500.1 unnamed protein product [Rotaria sp. Silwood1]